MPKGMLYGFAAAADFGFAWLFFSHGRVVLPAILAFAGLCFTIAAVGAIRGS